MGRRSISWFRPDCSLWPNDYQCLKEAVLSGECGYVISYRSFWVDSHQGPMQRISLCPWFFGASRWFPSAQRAVASI